MRTATLLAVWAGLALTACGGSEVDGRRAGADASPHDHGGAASSGDCADLRSDSPPTVLMRDNVFEPDCVTVSAKQRIELQNEGAAQHTFSSDTVDLDVRVAPGKVGATEPIGQILEAGTYDFHCTLHPEMSGRITVA